MRERETLPLRAGLLLAKKLLQWLCFEMHLGSLSASGLICYLKERHTTHGKSVRAIIEEKMWQILSHKGGDVNRECHHYQASPGTWIISVKDWLGNEWQERKRESHAHTPFLQQVSKPNHRACMDPTWRRRADVVVGCCVRGAIYGFAG